MGYQRATQTKTTEATNQRQGTTASKLPLSNRGSVHPLLQLQSQIGNRTVNHLIQTKLKVGKPGDIYEQEADRVAEKVMRMSASQVQLPMMAAGFVQTKPLVGQITPLVQRQEEEEETAQTLQRQEEEEETAQTLQRQEEEEETAQTLQRQEEEEETAQTLQRQEEEEETAQTLQRQEEEEETAQTLQRQEEEEETAQAKEAPSQTPTVTTNLEARIQSVRGGGKPLADSARNFFEPRFGAEFSDIRVHTDSHSTNISRELNAQAFTIGSDIFFDAGRYEPDTTAGKHLLAHELTHTIQQQPGRKLASPTKVEKSNSRGLLQRRQMGGVTSRIGVGLRSGMGMPAFGRQGTVPEAKSATPVAPIVRETAPPTPSETTSPASAEPQPAPAPETVESASVTPASKESTEGMAAGETGEATTETATEEMEAIPEEEPIAKAGEETSGETAEGKEAKKAPAKGKKTEATAEETPASPATDPGFQAVVKRAKRVAKQQRSHAPASAKSQEAQAASKPDPTSEVASKAQANQVDAMEQAETPAFDAVAFKAALMKRIAEIAPKKLEEADDFKKDNKLEGVKQETTATVKEEQTASQAPLKEKTEAPPDPSGIEPKPVTALPPADPGKKPPKINARQAAPKAKQPSQVETPLAENSQKLDQQTAEVDPPLTDEFLVKSKEPEFQTALDAKKEAQANAAEAPQTYRQFEKDRLSQAEAKAVATAQKQTQAMYTGRTQQFGQVESQQGDAKSKDEQAREKVASDIQKIYDDTKTKVEKTLSDLDTKVEQAFDTGAAAAKQAFEDYVDREMRTYKRRRYDRIGGSLLWGKDKLLGMPDEVNEFYTEGRRRFIEDMDTVIDNVVTIVAQGLTDAKTEIAKGKKKIKDYVAKLPEDLQKVGEDAATDIESQFKDLEESVNDKQGELIDTLAQKYQENLQAVDARIEELKAANQGLVDKAINAVAGVIKTIIKLKNLLLSVLAKVAKVVTDIISDPIGFLGNLIKGLSQGFQNFVGNIFTHLQTGMIAWLTGTLGPTGIQIPDNLFSLPGIFSLVMQVLGLTWDYIRAKAVKMFSEPVVAAMEKGAEIFQVLRTGGPMGLWQYVKEQFTDLKEMVIEQIKSMVTNEVIKAGVKWILGLLSPVGAFVKAAIAIYDIIMFFVDRAAQIGEFINSVIDAVAAIAKGAVGGAAKLVENALAKSLPIIIGLLASLAGVTGLAKKVQNIIKKIRIRIDKAITKLLKKARSAFKKLLKKGKATAKKVKEKVKALIKKQFSMGSERHTLTAKTKGKSIMITMASDADLVLSSLLSSAITEVENDKNREDSQKKAIISRHLSPAKARVDNIRREYEEAGQPEAFGKFIKPRLAKIVGDLSGLGKYKPPITSLQNVIAQGKPRYRPARFNIRKRLYDATTKGEWKKLSKKLRTEYKKKIRPKFFKIWKLRDDKSYPKNYVKARLQWDAAQSAKEIPVKKAPSFDSYNHPKHFPKFEYETDHKKSLGEFWNAGEKNSDDAKRRATTLDESNLQVLTKEENNEKSGVRFDPDFGPDFSSEVANSPKGSATIDGKPFRDEPL